MSHETKLTRGCWFRMDCPTLVLEPGTFITQLEGGYWMVVEEYYPGAIKVEEKKTIAVPEMSRWNHFNNEQLREIEQGLNHANHDSEMIDDLLNEELRKELDREKVMRGLDTFWESKNPANRG